LCGQRNLACSNLFRARHGRGHQVALLDLNAADCRYPPIHATKNNLGKLHFEASSTSTLAPRSLPWSTALLGIGVGL
jgi:hypothetical protein